MSVAVLQHHYMGIPQYKLRIFDHCSFVALKKPGRSTRKLLMKPKSAEKARKQTFIILACSWADFDKVAKVMKIDCVDDRNGYGHPLQMGVSAIQKFIESYNIE